MKPRITVITLGVEDLETAVRFYRDGLGLKTEGIVGAQFEYGAVAFFDLQAGLKLALWPRASLAHDTGLELASPSSTEFSIGHNVWIPFHFPICKCRRHYLSGDSRSEIVLAYPARKLLSHR